MNSIDTVRDYNEALKRIDELLVKVGDNQSYDNPEFVMLDRLSDMVADFEDENFKIETPSLIEVDGL